MVALLKPSETLPKTSPRARAHFRSCMLPASGDFKSNADGHLRGSLYGEGGQLGSCSRDPIGFEGSPWNCYEFLRGSPANELDPSGLTCVDDYNACDRESEADYRDCLRRGGRFCYAWYLADQATCSAEFTACVARAPALVCAGAVVVVGGAVICCADTPLPGPADAPGAAVIACGCAIMSSAYPTVPDPNPAQ